MRVVLTVLDALPHRHVGPHHTPALHALAELGGWAPDGARAVMTSATYPNHATFVTGADPSHHGVVTNWVPETGRVVPAWRRGPDVPTLFDACRRAGRTSAAVVGDQHLVGVMGAAAADRHWPPAGVPPEGLELDVMGYLLDADTVAELCAVLDGAVPDLVVAQLNGPDTAAHVHGPDADAALDAYRATDAWLPEIRARLSWRDTVWIVVSDHDQETVTAREPVDLQRALAERGTDLFALPEGNAAVVCGEGARAARAWLTGIDGVEGAGDLVLADRELECCLVWAEPGHMFGFAGLPARRGTHGGPRTCTQVAVVMGGHAAVEPLARAVASRPVAAADWAPTIATLLDLDLPTATGRSLL